MNDDFFNSQFLLIDCLNLFVKSRIQVPLSTSNSNGFRVAISDEKNNFLTILLG